MNPQQLTGTQLTLSQLSELAPYARTLKIDIHDLASTQSAGDFKRRRRGFGIDFSEVRPYQAGDDIRHIDWRVSARRGDLHSKVYHEVRSRQWLLVVDLSDSLFFGTQHCFKHLVSAQLASILGFYAKQQGDHLQALLVQGEEHQFIPQHRHNLHTILKSLSQTKPKHNAQHPDYAALVKTLHQYTNSQSVIVWISDFYQAEHATTDLQALGLNRMMLGLHVSDPFEKRLPQAATYHLQSPSGQHYVLHGQHENVRQAYERDYANRLLRMQTCFRNMLAPWLEFSTTDHVPKRLQQLCHWKYHGS